MWQPTVVVCSVSLSIPSQTLHKGVLSTPLTWKILHIFTSHMIIGKMSTPLR